MNDFVILMWKPLLACMILTGMHAYLGVHVIERKVIFVDLALAQIAALGACVALLFGFDVTDPAAYWFSLSATFIGAVIFSLTRTRKETVPHEAIIGIVYAVSAALAILLLSRSAEGDEHIRQMLVGNVSLVTTTEILYMAVLYGLIGLVHWVFRRQFVIVSTQPETAYKRHVSVKLWDLLFYLTFGLVVTSSVKIAGVLMVFTFLIVPSVAAILFSQRLSVRLLIGWAMGFVGSLMGIALSYFLDLPTGATVVCSFGVILVLLSVFRRFKR